MEEYGTALFKGAEIFNYLSHETLDEALKMCDEWNADNLAYEHGDPNVICIVVRRTAPVEAGPWEPAICNPTDVKEALYGAGKMGAL
jgi:hypothetical protein